MWLVQSFGIIVRRALVSSSFFVRGSFASLARKIGRDTIHRGHLGFHTNLSMKVIRSHSTKRQRLFDGLRRIA